MQNARSTAAISRASEGYHFSHDALVTCKLPKYKHTVQSIQYNMHIIYRFNQVGVIIVTHLSCWNPSHCINNPLIKWQ